MLGAERRRYPVTESGNAQRLVSCMPAPCTFLVRMRYAYIYAYIYIYIRMRYGPGTCTRLRSDQIIDQRRMRLGLAPGRLSAVGLNNYSVVAY